MDVLARVQSLLDDGLHQSARVVCALALSDSRMRASAAMLPPPTTTLSHDDRVHLTVLLGDALVAAGEQRHAMRHYEQALSLLYGLNSDYAASSAGTARGSGPLPSEAAIRFRFGKCAYALKEYAVGKQAMLAVPAKRQTVPMLVLLARFHEECGEMALAVQAYRAVLRFRPDCVEAFDALLHLEGGRGTRAQPIAAETTCAVKGSVVDATLRTLDDTEETRSLADLVRARRAIASFLYEDALALLLPLAEAHPNNTDVLVEIACANLKRGDALAAFYTFQQIRRSDPDCLDGMDKYAALLAGQGKIADLNRLAGELIVVNDARPEPWVGLARCAEAKGNGDRALSFVEKALALDRKHAEAHRMKGTVFMSRGRSADALLSYRRAHKLEPDAFTYEGLIMACVELRKSRESTDIAREAIRSLPTHPRIMTTAAQVLRGVGEMEKAQKMLEAAVRANPRCVTAVNQLATFMCGQQKHRESLQLLEKFLSYHHTEWMHCRVAEVHLQLGDCDKASDHFNIALSINPDFERAREGLQRVEISRNHGPNDGDGVDAGEHSMEGGEDVAFDEAEDDFDMATNEFD